MSRNIQEIEKELKQAKKERNSRIILLYKEMSEKEPGRPKSHILSEIGLKEGLSSQAVGKLVKNMMG